MVRKEKVVWVCFGALVVLLFLLSSTDLIIKEKKVEIYSISVVVEDSKGDNYVNFRKGADQAAAEMNADVTFITLYDDRDWQQQADLILREQEDGAEALVVAPALVDEAVELVKKIQVPVVLLNSGVPRTDNRKTVQVDFDFEAMGRQLGEMILEDHGTDGTVYLLGDSGAGDPDERFSQGISGTLEAAGCRNVFVEYGDGAEEAAGSWKTGKAEDAVLVGLDPESLLQIVRDMGNDPDSFRNISGLYGRGNSVELLNALERGTIQGLCVTDDFTAGYQCVKKAVALINGEKTETGEILRSGCIRKEDLRSPEYEKMLYPIE